MMPDSGHARRRANPVLRGVQAEDRHRLQQLLRLLAQALGRRRTLFHQGRVLLRGLVHLGHGLADLLHALALLGAGRADGTDDLAHALDGRHDLGHGLAGLGHHGVTGFDPFDAGADQRLDLACGGGAALRQCPHLAGDDREASALLAGARCLHRGVERQDVGLEGDAVDGADDVGDLATALLDAGHRADHLADQRPALAGDVCGRLRQRARVAGMVGVQPHGGAQLLHRRSRLLQRTGLLFGACRQVVVALGDLGAGGGHALGVAAHAGDRERQGTLHAPQGAGQHHDFFAASDVGRAREIALCHAVRQRHGLLQRGELAPHAPHQRAQRADAGGQHQAQHPQAGLARRVVGRGGHLQFFGLDGLDGVAQQGGGLAVHALHGGVPGGSGKVRGLEGGQALAVALAHALMRLHEALHQVVRRAGCQLSRQGLAERLHLLFLFFEAAPVLGQALGLRAAQQGVLPLLHLGLERRPQLGHRTGVGRGLAHLVLVDPHRLAAEGLADAGGQRDGQPYWMSNVRPI